MQINFEAGLPKVLRRVFFHLKIFLKQYTKKNTDKAGNCFLDDLMQLLELIWTTGWEALFYFFKKSIKSSWYQELGVVSAHTAQDS